MFRFNTTGSSAVALVLVLVLVLVAGCATTEEVVSPPPLVAPAPEALNIPEPAGQPADCDCEAGVVATAPENHFDRGVRALAARDYVRARVYFERHRDAGGEQSRREADVGIAFVTLLDRSVSEEDRDAGASGVDERAEVMILAMAAVDLLEGQLSRLAELNRALASDLEKREEALKRLRDLTLGQPEG